MPRKNVLIQYHSIKSGDMSGNLTSPVTNISYLDNIVIQLNASGTPNGTFSVETSLDYQVDSLGNVINAGTWNALVLSPAPTITASGVITIDINQLAGTFLRVKWTANGGAGTLNMYLAAKEV